MTCSSDTSHWRRFADATADTARIIGVGPQTYSRRSVDRGVLASSCSRGTVTRPWAPRLPSSVEHDDANAQSLEDLDAVKILGAARAIEQRSHCAPCQQRLRQGDERREADTTRNHPRFGGRIHGLEGATERPEALQVSPWLNLVEQSGSLADALVENGDAGGKGAIVAKHFEDRERTTQQRIHSARRLQHDELPGLRGFSDRRRRKREHAVVG